LNIFGVTDLNWLYRIGKIVVGAFFRLFTRLQVKGKENGPRKGAVLVVSNHLNFSDPALLGSFLGRQLTFMAKQELFRFRLWAWFLSSLGAFPVHRGRLDREAIRQSERALAGGKALLMFPEATRSPNARLQRALPGSALIAVRHSVPILPVGISGMEELGKAFWIFRRPRITINIGPTFSLPEAGSRLTKEELAENTELIMRRIAELLPPEYRGVYGDKAK
jgi:1-acyl-sn-glycerol-3-phosphate acyltransferase